jgi:plasmid stabilization system protein ParE
MNHVLNYSQKAREEFKDAVEWYEEKEDGLGTDLEKEILDKVEMITKYPLRYPVKRGDYRQTLIKRFPYLIVYRYNKMKHQITIISFFHTSRNPKNKYRQ